MRKNILSIALLALAIPFTAVLHGIHGGAGVLPYAKDQGTGQIYFLLGQDLKRPGVWTDFGGGGKAYSTPEDAAAGIAQEESLGVLSGTHMAPIEMEKQGLEALKSRILAAKNAGRLVKLEEGFPFTTYFIDITDMAKDSAARTAIIGLLVRNLEKYKAKMIKNAVTPLQKKYKGMCEKKVFMWVKRQDLLKAIQDKGSFKLFAPFKKDLKLLPESFFNF